MGTGFFYQNPFKNVISGLKYPIKFLQNLS